MYKDLVQISYKNTNAHNRNACTQKTAAGSMRGSKYGNYQRQTSITGAALMMTLSLNGNLLFREIHIFLTDESDKSTSGKKAIAAI